MTEDKMRTAVLDAKRWGPRFPTHLVLHPEDLMTYLLRRVNRAEQMIPNLDLPNFPTFEKKLKDTSTRLVFQGVTVITDTDVPRGEVHVI